MFAHVGALSPGADDVCEIDRLRAAATIHELQHHASIVIGGRAARVLRPERNHVQMTGAHHRLQFHGIIKRHRHRVVVEDRSDLFIEQGLIFRRKEL